MVPRGRGSGSWFSARRREVQEGNAGNVAPGDGSIKDSGRDLLRFDCFPEVDGLILRA